MLRIYFDDSGTHAGSPVIVVGGLFGFEIQWQEFEQKWAALLANPLPDKPALKKFSSAACRWGEREFATYKPAERDLVTREFRRIIMDTGLLAFSCAMDMTAYNELVVGELKAILTTPEVWCFNYCLTSIFERLANHLLESPISVFYDVGRADAPNIHAFLAGILDPEFAKTFGHHEPFPRQLSVALAPVAECLPLQGADMIATEVFWDAQQWLTSGGDDSRRPHFKELADVNRGHGGIVNRKHLIEALARIVRASLPNPSSRP